VRRPIPEPARPPQISPVDRRSSSAKARWPGLGRQQRRRQHRREAIYDDLLPGERTRLHTRFAEVLGSDPGLAAPGRAVVEQAHHWYHAHDTTGALISAWCAAADARRALAYAEQLTLLARVLELWAKVPDATRRIGASHLAVLERAAGAAQAAEENGQGIAYATAAQQEVDARAEPVRAAMLLETHAAT